MAIIDKIILIAIEDIIGINKDNRLFPKLVENVNSQCTSSFSKWFGRYLCSTIGITDKRKTFHSFRHGFKEACRVAEITKELHDKLTGHISSDVDDGYGGDLYPLMPLYNAIKKIEFQLEYNPFNHGVLESSNIQ